MAIAPLWISIRTTGANALRNLSNGFRRLAANARVSMNQMMNSFIARGGLPAAFGRMGRQLGNAGRRMGASLGNGILSGLDGIARNPAIVGAGLAIGAVLAPAIGAALSAGLTAIVAGAVTGAGIAVAIKQSDALQKAFGGTFRVMGDDFKRFSSFFEDELFGVAGRFRAAWRDIGDDFQRAFEKAQTFVEPLADGLAGLVENMIGGGGFNAAMDAAGPVISALSTGLSRLGEAFDSFFQSLADSGEGAVEGMHVLMAALSGAIRGLGNTVEFLAKTFDAVTDAGEPLARFFADMLGWVPGLGGWYRSLADAMGGFNDASERTSSIQPVLGATTQRAAGSIERQAAAAEAAAKAAQELSDKLSGLISSQLSADQAALQWEVTLDQLAESIKENGRSLDITNAKGQANVGIVHQMIQIALQAKQAAIELAGGEHASAEAVARANAAFAAQIGQLRAVLTQAGFTQAQIDALLKKYEQIARAPDISKTITITTRYVTRGSPGAGNPHGGYQASAYASGTESARAGVALVGERGPELVTFGGGERVYPASETARLLAGGRPAAGWGGGGGGVAVVRPYVPTNANRDVVNAITAQLRLDVQRQSRGDVQRHFGSSGRI